jgi:transcription-repair coupling factor (superfamily II helicase)
VVDLHVPALFPRDYLANPHTRLVMYKRIASAASIAELEELQIETIDRFGLLPDAGKNLFRLTAMRLQAERAGISKIDMGDQGGSIEFMETTPVDVASIIDLVRNNPHRYRLAGPTTLRVTEDLEDTEIRLSFTEGVLDELCRALPGPG